MNQKYLALAAILNLASLSVVRADVMVWTNTAGGSFHNPANWLPNAVPFTNDTAVFQLTDAPYTVKWHENVTNHTHIVRAGTVTFDLQGYTYSLQQTSTNRLGTASSTAILTVTNDLYAAGEITYIPPPAATTLMVR